jgi:hypothetical protein
MSSPSLYSYVERHIPKFSMPTTAFAAGAALGVNALRSSWLGGVATAAVGTVAAIYFHYRESNRTGQGFSPTKEFLVGAGAYAALQMLSSNWVEALVGGAAMAAVYLHSNEEITEQNYNSKFTDLNVSIIKSFTQNNFHQMRDLFVFRYNKLYTFLDKNKDKVASGESQKFLLLMQELNSLNQYLTNPQARLETQLELLRRACVGAFETNSLDSCGISLNRRWNSIRSEIDGTPEEKSFADNLNSIHNFLKDQTPQERQGAVGVLRMQLEERRNARAQQHGAHFAQAQPARAGAAAPLQSRLVQRITAAPPASGSAAAPRPDVKLAEGRVLPEVAGLVRGLRSGKAFSREQYLASFTTIMTTIGMRNFMDSAGNPKSQVFTDVYGKMVRTMGIDSQTLTVGRANAIKTVDPVRGKLVAVIEEGGGHFFTWHYHAGNLLRAPEYVMIDGLQTIMVEAQKQTFTDFSAQPPILGKQFVCIYARDPLPFNGSFPGMLPNINSCAVDASIQVLARILPRNI